jgi:hypothetical protein
MQDNFSGSGRRSTGSISGSGSGRRSTGSIVEVEAVELL